MTRKAITNVKYLKQIKNIKRKIRKQNKNLNLNNKAGLKQLFNKRKKVKLKT